jgi:hypothetical protein
MHRASDYNSENNQSKNETFTNANAKLDS